MLRPVQETHLPILQTGDLSKACQKESRRAIALQPAQDQRLCQAQSLPERRALSAALQIQLLLLQVEQQQQQQQQLTTTTTTTTKVFAWL